MKMDQTLGTVLRHLLEQLDGDVERAYDAAGLNYRARYTPVVRALVICKSASIAAIAEQAGITHSAASQTIAMMRKNGLVEVERGADGRERTISLSPLMAEMLPAVQRIWAATAKAASTLDDDLEMPLADLLRRAIGALQRESFEHRICDALHIDTKEDIQ